MDAILAQMRAAQGIVEDVSDDDAQTAAGDEFGASTTTASTTPSAEAAYHRAMVSLCAEFASATKERLGGRWYSHFESWLYSRRERPDEPFPRGEDPRRDKELVRKLRAAGSTSGEAKYICKRLGKASEAARRSSLSAGAADARRRASRSVAHARRTRATRRIAFAKTRLKSATACERLSSRAGKSS